MKRKLTLVRKTSWIRKLSKEIASANPRATNMRRIIMLAVVLVATAVGLDAYASQAAIPDKSPTKSAELDVYVYGAVTSPGHYRWSAGMTVLDAIQAAGGFTNSPANRIWISHQDSPDTRVSYKWENPKSPPILRVGDSIDVPKDILASQRQASNPEPVR